MSDLETARASADRMWSGDNASKALGMQVEVPAAGAAIATMRVREDMVNGFKVCHGGLVFTLADTAFAFACNGYGDETVAAAAQIEFLRPTFLGDELRAEASEEHRGRRSGYYSVRIYNQDDVLVALFRGRSAQTRAPVATG